jgi:arylsulfatase A-like enzyme
MPSLRHLLLILLLPIAPELAAATASAPARPANVVVILADDLGYTDLGCYGGTEIPTPQLDALARGGARFTAAYTSGCVCSPTRAGFLAGRYQQRYGFDANAEGRAQPADRGPRALEKSAVTFAQRMKSAGYATGLVGKWHVGAEPGYRPTERGFDEFYGLYPYGLAAADARIHRGLEPTTQPANAMAAFADEALGFIDRHAARPFFLYLAFTAVHGPFVGPSPYRERFSGLSPANRGLYAADLVQMDDIVGRVAARLRERGLDRNTLLVFLGDNGGPGGAARNGVLRGTKWTLWEGGIRVPMIASWPGRIPAGQTIAAPAIQIDLLPTALAVAGVTPAPEWRLDGRNLLPLLEGRAASDSPPLFWRFGPQYAVRAGNWKLLKPHLNAAPQLYDLTADPGEKSDRAAREPARVAALQATWDRWNADNETPRWIDQRWNGDGPRPGGKAKKK